MCEVFFFVPSFFLFILFVFIMNRVSHLYCFIYALLLANLLLFRLYSRVFRWFCFCFSLLLLFFCLFPVLLIGLDDLCKSHHFNTPKTNQRAISHRLRGREGDEERELRHKMDVLCVLHRNEEASTTTKERTKPVHMILTV